MPKLARFYTEIEDYIQCDLCPHYCKLKNGQTSLCKSRQNLNNQLVVLNYGKLTALHFDPIEKKPLYHFFPGKEILSIGTFGCNFRCSFCQNHTISQKTLNTKEYLPEDILNMCLKQNLKMVAFTYNEPTIWYEFVYDTAKLLHENDIKTVLVTNGYINVEPLIELSPYISAVNIDLKSMSDKFYKEMCGGSVNEVKTIIELCLKLDIFVEITNLVIPKLNDSMRETTALIDYIASLSKNIPVHFSKYFPSFMLEEKATPLLTLSHIYHKASKKLNYVYLGNVDGYSNTFCPNCKTTLIYRKNFETMVTGLRQGLCKNCGEKINGVWR